MVSRSEVKKSKLRVAAPAQVAAPPPAPVAAPSPALNKAKRVEREEDQEVTGREMKAELPVELERTADPKRLTARKEAKELPSLFGDLLDPSKIKKVKKKLLDPEEKEKKRSRLKETGGEDGGQISAEGELKRKKKKKVVQGDADEIDSIFG